MEVVTGNSSQRLSLEQIVAFDTQRVPETDNKFGGFSGCGVRALLADGAESGAGVFIAADGMTTESIAFDILAQGILLHTDAQGQPLPRGGPLRAWFPAETELRCGSGNPLCVKDVRTLMLS